jgi:hypothetical protein
MGGSSVNRYPATPRINAVAVSVRADDLATARTIHPARHAGSVIAEQKRRLEALAAIVDRGSTASRNASRLLDHECETETRRREVPAPKQRRPRWRTTAPIFG